MTRSTKPCRQKEPSPLDRLIGLIAEIEVEDYLKEAKRIEEPTAEGEDEGSDLRTLQQ